MTVRLYGATSGYVDLDAPSVAGSASIFIPADSGILATQSYANSSSGLQLITSQSFSAVATVSVNNCFTSTYQNYMITMQMTTGATGNSLFRLRSNGSDASGNDYNQQRSSLGSTTYMGARLQNQSGWFSHGYVSTLNYLIIYIFRPNELAPTASIAQMGRGTDTLIDMDDFRLGHTISTSYDGFTMGFGSNSNGTIRIYGYKN
jgi:hypothetical protein